MTRAHRKRVTLLIFAVLAISTLTFIFYSRPVEPPTITEPNRIFFTEGNPWPEGHAIKHCYLDARLYEGPLLQLTIHLETKDYRENDDGEFLDNNREGNWESKVAWNNYHSCNIDGVILRATLDNPVSIDSLESSAHVVDQLPDAIDKFMEDELEFSIYLLGHDSVADHRIEFGTSSESGLPMKWTGRIALSYSGEYDFDYAFALETTLKSLERVWYPEDWDDAKAEKTLASLLKEADQFLIRTVDGRKAFVRRTQSHHSS